MTAILNALRGLDARLDRGEITPEEYARRRKTLLSTVEEAETDFVEVTPRDVTPRAERPHSSTTGRGRAQASAVEPDLPRGSSAAGLGVVVVFAVMGLCMALTLAFLENMNLALTLGVTILAAISVALLHGSDS